MNAAVDTLEPRRYNAFVEAGFMALGTPPVFRERTGSSVQRLASQLRRAGVQLGRVAKCGQALFPVQQQSGEVQLMASEPNADGRRRGYWSGIETCSSTWSCPHCSSVLRRERSREVVEAADAWRAQGGHCDMLTATFSHEKGDDLAELVKGLQAALSDMFRGASWKRLKEYLAIEHSLRGFEVTHGPNGWHPHFHILLFLKGDAQSKLHVPHSRWGMVRFLEGSDTEFEWVQKPNAKAREEKRGQGWREATPWQWTVARWQSCVVKRLGKKRAPSCERGLKLKPANNGAAYLAKLGLELADPGGKKKGRRRGHRSAFELAAMLAASPSDKRLRGAWLEYQNALSGKRHLVWSQVKMGRFTVSSYVALTKKDEVSDEVVVAASEKRQVEEGTGAEGASAETQGPCCVLSLPWEWYDVLWRSGASATLLALLDAGASDDQLRDYARCCWEQRQKSRLWLKKPALFVGSGFPDVEAA